MLVLTGATLLQGKTVDEVVAELQKSGKTPEEISEIKNHKVFQELFFE